MKAAEDIYYEVSVLMSELNIMSKKTNTEDRALAQIQIQKMRDILDEMDALYGELAEE